MNSFADGWLVVVLFSGFSTITMVTSESQVKSCRAMVECSWSEGGGGGGEGKKERESVSEDERWAGLGSHLPARSLRFLGSISPLVSRATCLRHSDKPTRSNSIVTMTLL